MAAVQAATINVTTTTDELTNNSQCSLREAVRNVNAQAAAQAQPYPDCTTATGSDVIQLGGGTYRLTLNGNGEDAAATGDLDVLSGVIVTIRGSGTAPTLIDGDRVAAGANADRVFDVKNGGTLHLEQLGVVNGQVGVVAGGGITNAGVLTLDTVGMASNISGGPGGGISNTGSLSIVRSQFLANIAGATGGGVDSSAGMTVTDSLFTLNTATGALGGGGMSLTGAGTAQLINVTISGNSANAGGAIRSAIATTLNNVTAASNSSGLLRIGGTLTVSNSILANATSDCAGTVTSAGYNLVQDSTCGFLGSGDQQGAPLIGALADNGGPTQTHRPLPNSPVVDAGNPALPGSVPTACVATDQRGSLRAVDGNGDGVDRCDIGAMERGVVVTVDRTDDVAGAAMCSGGASDCSLRGAITKANAGGFGPHDITLPAGNYRLTLPNSSGDEDNNATGDLDVRQKISILGDSAKTTYIEAGSDTASGIDRVIEVVGPTAGDLTLLNATVRHGNVTGSGGGIRADGPLHLVDVHVAKNQASVSAGGVQAAATTVITDSTLSANSAVGGLGGGLLASSSDTVTLTNTTISGNSASSSGGGVFQTSTSGVAIASSTVVGNTAGSGGGIALGAGNVSLRDTIVADNVAANSPNCSGEMTSLGTNLVFGGDTCDFTATGDIQGFDPQLGPLQDNGGDTPTHAPAGNSRAVDRGSALCPPLDQRGAPRPVDGDGNFVAVCDIGAFERGRVFQVDTVTDSNVAAFRVCGSASNDCSLRGAISEANMSLGPHAIQLRDGDIYTLTLTGIDDDNAAGDLDIRQDISIKGGGASSTAIEAAASPGVANHRVLHIVGGTGGRLDLRDVTVRHGKDGFGAGIHAQGPLTLVRDYIHSNVATVSAAGGVFVQSTAAISDTTISANTASSGGGGLSLAAGLSPVSLSNVTVSGNGVVGGLGGGGGLSIAGSGGNGPTDVTLTNVTIANNNGGPVGNGGGISSFASGGVKVRNSIVAGNASAANPNCFGGNLTSLGNNLVFGGDSCNFTATGDLQNQDPRLGGLAGNGGSIPTHALGFGSAAIDAGNPGSPGSGGNACTASDERGTARPLDGNHAAGAVCDIGAFEAPPCPPVTVSVNSAGANALGVVVGAGGGTISRIRGIPAKSTNVVVDVNGQLSLPTSFDVAIPGNPVNLPLTLHRPNNSGSGTLSLIVTDSCGDWTTLAGGGSDQVWGTQGGPLSSPPSVAIPSVRSTSGVAPTPGAACATFPSHAAAQAYLRADPTDPLLLDSNRNGVACEGSDGAGFVNPPLDHVPVPRP